MVIRAGETAIGPSVGTVRGMAANGWAAELGESKRVAAKAVGNPVGSGDLGRKTWRAWEGTCARKSGRRQ